MKFCVLILILFSLSAWAGKICLKGEDGARKHFQNEFSPRNIKDLQLSALPSSQGKIFLVTDPVACGVRGCDFTLSVEDKAGCVSLALTGNGNVVAVKTDDYTVIQVTTRNLPVDKRMVISHTYSINPKTHQFEEIRTK